MCSLSPFSPEKLDEQDEEEDEDDDAYVTVKPSGGDDAARFGGEKPTPSIHTHSLSDVQGSPPPRENPHERTTTLTPSYLEGFGAQSAPLHFNLFSWY